MTFTVRKTSDWEYDKTIEINSLEQLMEFCKINGEIIIFRPHEHKGKTIGKIEIYDDYRE